MARAALYRFVGVTIALAYKLAIKMAIVGQVGTFLRKVNGVTTRKSDYAVEPR